jgi:nucleotide-binding universal stress UspA family protein
MELKILVAIDGSPAGEAALRQAVALAAEFEAQLLPMHVVDDYPMLLAQEGPEAFEAAREQCLHDGAELLAAAERAGRDAGVAVHPVLREVSALHVGDAIVDEARREHCGAVVMGSHGRRCDAARVAAGSDASFVLRHSPVPVLLVTPNNESSGSLSRFGVRPLGEPSRVGQHFAGLPGGDTGRESQVRVRAGDPEVGRLNGSTGPGVGFGASAGLMPA